MRIKMKDEETDDFLKRLQARLNDRALPPQEVIASAIDADQPFVSRAKSGSLKRITDRVRRLDDYLSRHVSLSVKADDRARSPAPGRSKPRPRADPERDETETKLARKSCETYLSEGYNPRVLIDQIDLLRQAQSRMR